MTFVDIALKVVVSGIYAALVAITGGAVFSRYVLNYSLVWAEELSRYLFIWIVCIGAALALARGLHISVDVAVARLKKPTQTWIALVSDIGILLFLLVLAVYGTALTLFGRHSYSLAMGLPMSWVYSALPIAAVLMIFYTIRRIIGGFREIRAS